MDALNELKTFAQWVAFELKSKEGAAGKFDKIPLNPRTGKRAMANNPATWATYDEAVALAKKRGYFENCTGGIGFELCNGIAGIDLDDVILPDGTLKEFARGIVELMNSYTEYSPSGTGLHILFKISGSPEEWREFLGGKLGTRSGGIEFYIGAHFFTITGKPYGIVKPINDRTEQARKFYEKYLAKPEVKKETAQKSVNSSAIELTDRELLEKMFSSQHGREILALYNGDISGYTSRDKSQSEADLALCGYLAFWTNGDANRMDNLFRQSGLMREKWNKKHGAETYGQMTIKKAIQNMREGYTGEFEQSTQERNKPEMLSEHNNDGNTLDEDDARREFESEIVTNRLNNFLMAMRESREGKAIPTGFSKLDEILDGGLYPGLYSVGAISSLGKTTLCLQMADNIACSGYGVLIFSLEMSANELIAKSLSRLTLIKDMAETGTKKNAKTTREILRGNYSEAEEALITKAINDYAKFGSRINITEGIGDVGVETIKTKVQEYKDYHEGKPPVVIIDYLQIIEAYDKRMTDKQNVDKNITELKRMSRDFQIPIIGISSFNRENYSAPVSMASFKESGAIEYSSDVLIGLQYKGFDYINGEQEKIRTQRLNDLREQIDNTVKNGGAVEVQLKVLKHRNGRRGEFVLEFFPQYNYFRAKEK